MSRKINSRGYYNSEIATLEKVVKKLKPGKIIPIQRRKRVRSCNITKEITEYISIHILE